MCGKCHKGLSDERIIEELKTDDKKFEEWNTTSLNHMLLIIQGCNGREAAELAYPIAKEYMEWKIAQTNERSEIIEYAKGLGALEMVWKGLQRNFPSREMARKALLGEEIDTVAQ